MPMTSEEQDLLLAMADALIRQSTPHPRKPMPDLQGFIELRNRLRGIGGMLSTDATALLYPPQVGTPPTDEVLAAMPLTNGPFSWIRSLWK